MKRPNVLLIAAIVALIAGLLASSAAHADILGFGNFSGFTVNQRDTGNAPTISGSTIQLTNTGGVSEFRSIFCDTPQNISGDFTASFTYVATGSADPGAGACFVLQNSSSGASQPPYGNAQFGYNDFPGNSIGVTLELETAGGGLDNASGYYTDGNYGGGSASTSPVNFLSGDPINATITYNGSTLTESFVDTVTQASYSNSFLTVTPIPTVLGGATAYVGLTTSSGPSPGGENQYFSNLQFTSAVPEPSTFTLLGVGTIVLLGYAWRRGGGIKLIGIAR
jgi:PEP-CTERM motif